MSRRNNLHFCSGKYSNAAESYATQMSAENRAGSKRLKTMNCRIVGAICQHNVAQAQRVLASFQRKEAYFF